MDNFIFDPIAHRYTLNGKELLSVTTILRLAGVTGDGRFFDDWSRQRGKAVHLAAQYLGEGDLDLESVDNQIMAYILAATQFLELSGFKPIKDLCEKPQYHPIHLYCGTPDWVGIMDGRPVLIEIKSGTDKGAELQTAAYSAFPEIARLKPRRFALRLTKKGTFKLVPHDDTNDFNNFLKALEKAKEIKEKHGSNTNAGNVSTQDAVVDCT